MKKLFIGVFALSLGVLMTACSGDSSALDELDKEADKMLEDARKNKAEREKKEAEANAMNISAEMTDFISGFDGTSDAVGAALEKYAGNDGVADNDMGFYNLKNPEITAQDGDCYSLTCISGAVENYYTICWEDGKISSIAEKM